MKKQKDGYYHTRIVVNGEPKSIRAKTLTELEEKRKTLKSNIFSEDMSVQILTDKWLEATEKTVKPTTYQSYVYSADKLKKKLGLYPVKNVRQGDIQELINEYCKQPRTVQMLKRTCQRIFNFGVDNDVIAKNPCRGLILPKYEKPEKRALTKEELKRISEAPFTDEERLLVSILLFTGIRRGEALALRKENIDYARRRLKIDHNLAFNGNVGQLTTPKTKTSVRTILMPTALLELLSNYDYDDFLFSRNGKPFTMSAFRRMWESICKKADIEVTPHTFRHNYASRLYLSGVDMKEAQRLLGHSSINVTMDIYTHLSEEYSNEVFEKIETLSDML